MKSVLQPYEGGYQTLNHYRSTSTLSTKNHVMIYFTSLLLTYSYFKLRKPFNNQKKRN